MADSAGILLFDDAQRVLMMKRDGKALKFPHKWSMFGGMMEEGETPLKAVLRETWEELRYRLHNPTLLCSVNIEHGQIHIFAEKYDGKQVLQQCEGEKMGWFSVSDVLELELSPPIREAFEKAVPSIGELIAREASQ